MLGNTFAPLGLSAPISVLSRSATMLMLATLLVAGCTPVRGTAVDDCTHVVIEQRDIVVRTDMLIGIGRPQVRSGPAMWVELVPPRNANVRNLRLLPSHDRNAPPSCRSVPNTGVGAGQLCGMNIPGTQIALSVMFSGQSSEEAESRMNELQAYVMTRALCDAGSKPSE